MRTILCIIALVAIQISVSAQSPWTQSKGSFFTQLSYSVIPKYNSIYVKDGDAFNTARFIKDKTIQLYGEYGITENTTILANLPLKILNAGDTSDVSDLPITIENGSLSGIGNIKLGARQKLLSGPVELAAQFDIGFPTISSDEMTGLVTGFDSWSFVPRINIGRGIDAGYVMANLGTTIRTSGLSSDFIWGLEGGYKFLDLFYLMVFLDGRHSFNNGDVIPSNVNQQTGLYLNNQEYLAFGIKTLIEIKNGFGITGAFGGAASGNLVARSPSLNIGVFYKK